jgi:hypothetical protein
MVPSLKGRGAGGVARAVSVIRHDPHLNLGGRLTPRHRRRCPWTRLCGLSTVGMAKRLIHSAVLDRLRAMRKPGESYGNVILRLFELSRQNASA